MNDRPTLEVSADQVARQDDGAWLITMEGWRTPIYTCDPTTYEIDTEPPPELVALLQPCPTCELPDGLYEVGEDGKGGLIEHLRQAVSRAKSDRCPDCGGSGRLVFDLQWPCDVDQCVNGRPGYWQDGGECGYCHGNLTASVRVYLDPEHGIKQDGDKFVARAVEVDDE